MLDDQRFRAQLYDAADRAWRFRGDNAAALAQWQADFRPRLREVLGLDTMARHLAEHRCRAEFRDAEALPDFRRERWYLWTEPTVALPFYLLRPYGDGPFPLVLTPHGHSEPPLYAGIAETPEQTEKMRSGERDIAVQAVQEGYLAIAPTTRGFGETRYAEARESSALHSCRELLLHGLLAGRTPTGMRVWDMQRLLDWALAELPADASRVAITGNSTGGTISLFAAACDERIGVCMPSCYFCTFRDSIGSVYHCDCNFVPGLLNLCEMADVAGLVAPRPLLAITGETDPLFPVNAVHHAHAEARAIYAAAGAADHCRLYVGDGGHRYYKAPAWPFVAEQFARA